MSSLNEHRLRTLIDATSSVFFIAKPDGRFVEPQPSWERYTGQQWPGYRNLGWLDAVYRDDIEPTAGLVEKAAERGEPIELEVRLWHHGTHSFRHVRGKVVPLHDDHGDLVEWVGAIDDVHDELLAQRRLEETASRLGAVLQNSPVGFAFLDRDLRVVMVNDALAGATGVDRPELEGHLLESLSPELEAQFGPHLRHVLTIGRPVTGIEVRAVEGPDGDLHDMLLGCYPVPGAEGELLGVGVTVVDVTERNALQALVHEVGEREARNRFRAVLDAMPDLVTILRAERDEHGRVFDFRVDYLNRQDTDPLGRHRDEIIGRLVTDAYPEILDQDLLDRCIDVVERREPATFDEVVFRQVVDGGRIKHTYTMQVVPFEDGLILAASDISERRRGELALHRAYEQLAAAQRLAHIGIWEIDLRSGLVTFTDELRRIFGLPADAEADQLPHVLDRFIHPDDREEVRTVIGELPGRGEPFATDFRIIRFDGEVRRVSSYGTTVFDRGGRPRRLWGTIQDVTEQRAAEDELRETAVRLERERAIVTRLQEAFLPEVPHVPGLAIAANYLPAGSEATIGGDWYDVFALDDDRVAFAVGDVAGHGLPAASLMAQLRNALRGAAFAGQSPDETLRTVNTMLLRTAADAMATCFYGVFDARSESFDWVSAGHLPALLCERGSSVRMLSEPPGPPLGMPDAHYDVHSVRLPIGATLVLYTDGLVEERTRSIDAGLDQLRSVVSTLVGVPVHDATDAIAQTMFFHRPRVDDVCLLVVRRGER